ncbi:pre-mRNA-splicing factor CWC22 homolog [Watersipora subatra]|uniref:pre-mRNA-splicing factor CWC22 homolog n=1 Tax=Watersipora subatra TaxID=2589382 RepID=UPI00355C2EE3
MRQNCDPLVNEWCSVPLEVIASFIPLSTSVMLKSESTHRSISPIGYGGNSSSEGECSTSDDGVDSGLKSTIASASKLSTSRKKNSTGPPSDTGSSSSSHSPKPKRRRSASHTDDTSEEDIPDWKKERSFTPEEERKPRQWTAASGEDRPRRSHRDREDAKERRDQRRLEDRRRRFNDDRDRISSGRRGYPQRSEYDRRDRRNTEERERWERRNRDDRRYEDRDRRYDRTERREDRRYDKDRDRDRNKDKGRKEQEDDAEKENKKDEESKEPKEKKDKEATLATRTGGAYIPPARLRMMQEAITDKSSAEYQRISWEALKKSINGLVNKVNVSNIKEIIPEILAENIIRGRGLLCLSVLRAQTASPTFTHVYAAVMAVINSKFPQIGELLLQRLILQFRRSYRRNDKNVCLTASQFIAHLVNQQVAHEIVALELLTLLLEKASDDSVEIAVGFLKEVGMKLTDVSPRGINAIFDRMRNVLHEAKVELRVQYMIEVMFQVRKDKFKDHASVIEQLELVDEEEQFTHSISLDEVTNGQDLLNVFKVDPDFMENEQKYKDIKKEILSDSDDDSGESHDGSGSDSGSSSPDEADAEEQQNILDMTETNLIGLRRTIYLTLQSSLDYEEAAHKLLKLQLKPGQESELCNMVLDCGAQQRTYEKFYGLLAQRFCMIHRKYVEQFESMFMSQYETCHRLDPTKLRNVSKFFGHLLHTDAISWGVLRVVKMNEDDTTSSSRIFVKQLFLELAEYMGLPKLNERLKDETLQSYFEGIMPKDHPKKTRFAINFFTSIGLGGLTDGLREHLKNMPKPSTGNLPPSSSSSSSSSDSSSSSSSSDSSDSD